MNVFLKGIKWSLILQIVDILGKILFTSILARILNPDDFGIVSMVTILTSVSYIIINFGFSQYIITNKNLKNSELSSIFWFNSFLGLAITVVICICAKKISEFYNESALVTISYAISFIYLFNSCSIVPNAILNRNMDFKKLTIRSIVISLFSYFIAFVLALNGAKYWSLVVQLVLTDFLNFIILLKLSKWRPNLYFSKSELLKGIKYSSYIFFNEITSYFTRNVDNVLVGRYFGTQLLAVYTKSFALINLPLQSINAILFRVAVPYISKISDNKDEIENLFFKLLVNITLLVFILMSTVLLASKHFVYVFFGEKWNEMIPLLKWFGVAAIVNGIYRIVPMILVSIGDVKLNLKLGIIHKLILIFSIFTGIFISFKFLVIFRSIAELFMFSVSFVFISKRLDLNLKNLLYVVIAIVMLLSIFIILSLYTNFLFSDSYGFFYSFFLLILVLLGSALTCYTVLFFVTKLYMPNTLISLKTIRSFTRNFFKG